MSWQEAIAFAAALLRFKMHTLLFEDNQVIPEKIQSLPYDMSARSTKAKRCTQQGFISGRDYLTLSI